MYAANATRFAQGYRELARQLKLPGHDNTQVDTCKLVSDWLNEDDGDTQWLFVLDNADDADDWTRTLSNVVGADGNEWGEV